MAKLDFPDASYSPWVAPNNVIYTYIGTSPNGYWEANTANAATNLTAVFVERTGSTMTGPLISGLSGAGYGYQLNNGNTNLGGLYKDTGSSRLLLGDGSTTKIDLQGSSGSATFGGDVVVGNNPTSSSTNNGLMFRATGGVIARRASGTDNAFAGFISGNASETSKITAAGSATFAGRVNAGTSASPVPSNFAIAAQNNDSGTNATIFGNNLGGGRLLDLRNNSSAKVIIQGDGSATFASQVSTSDRFDSNRTSGSYAVFNGRLNNTVSTSITADGSATFAGTMEVQDGASGVTTSLSDALTIEASDVTSKTRGLGIYGKSSITSTFEAFQLRHGANQNITFKYDGSATFAGNVDIATPETSSGGVRTTSDGSVYIRPTDSRGDSSGAFEIYKNAYTVAGRTVQITKSGSATFAGNVGIGTSSPSSKLHISGAYNQEGLKIFSGASGYTSPLIVGNSGSGEYMRIDGSGRLLVNTTVSRIVEDSVGNGPQGKIQIEATNSDSIMSIISAGTADANRCGTLSLARHRNSTVGGTPTAVVQNDKIGAICFAGGDGVDMRSKGATIICAVDGANSSENNMPARIEFATSSFGSSSPTERMRIDSSGNVGINTASPSAQLHVYDAGGQAVIKTDILNTASQFTYAIQGVFGGTTSFHVIANGNCANTNNSFGAISDVKLKENIVDANSQWDDIKGLRVRNYNFIEGQTHTQIGVVAQEVETVSPGLVNNLPDRDKDGSDLGTTTKSVNYSVLYMKAVKALQEAMTRIETLEQRLSDAGIA